MTLIGEFICCSGNKEKLSEEQLQINPLHVFMTSFLVSDSKTTCFCWSTVFLLPVWSPPFSFVGKEPFLSLSSDLVSRILWLIFLFCFWRLNCILLSFGMTYPSHFKFGFFPPLHALFLWGYFFFFFFLVGCLPRMSVFYESAHPIVCSPWFTDWSSCFTVSLFTCQLNILFLMEEDARCSSKTLTYSIQLLHINDNYVERGFIYTLLMF